MSNNKIKKPWPTKKAMEQVYEKKLWGGNDVDFFSGEGSNNKNIIIPYLNEVQFFFDSFKTPLIVCDLGCGDFNIGSKLVKFTKKYVGIDIVESLVERNIKKYKFHNLDFLCKNIAIDILPEADCVIIRQVLQHLSNNEIIKILEQLKKYKYIILTEHLPDTEFISNIDIISGQGIRLKKNSGVNILEAPFNFKVIDKKEILSTRPLNNKGLIKTTIYTVF